MPHAIETKQLTKTYSGLKAVDNLNISVESGEIFGLSRTQWSWKNNRCFNAMHDSKTNLWHRNGQRI